MTQPRPASRRLALATLPLVLGIAACGGTGSGGGTVDDPGSDGGAAGNGDLTVVTSFYPIEYLASRLAGEHAEVTTLTSAGVDPHDVELTPRQVAGLSSADLVLYTAGMQPAVDQAVQAEAGERAVDLAPHANLLMVGEAPDQHDGHDHEGADDEHEHDEDHDHDHADDHHDHDHADDEHEHDDGHDHADDDEDHDHDHEHDHADDHHDHGPEDPHFWLDPERYGQVAEVIAAELSTVDPGNAEHYEANLALLLTDLETLDQEFTEGLAQCRSRDLVTTHEAFGYLAHRYDLRQTGITGIAPESEPSPARLAEVTAQVRDLGVQAIFAEPILQDGIAQTIATETGVEVLTLDPLEGITDSSTGSSYPEIMRANLDALREGLGCS